MTPSHTLSIEALAQSLAVDPAVGLSDEAVLDRRNQYGLNALDEAKQRLFFRIFFDQFINPIILLFLTVIGISLTIGHGVDATILAILVLVNTAIGALQEYQAEKAMAGIRTLSAPKAHVLREGKTTRIPASDLVPGDIVILEAGDRIPADLRFIALAGLQVDESLLTGESAAVLKQVDPLPHAHVAIGDQTNMGFMGTHVLTGHGKGLCVGTGLNSELGKISEMLASRKSGESPLTQRMNRLTRQMAIAAFCLSLIIFVVGLGYGVPPSEMLLTAIALAVSAIPEGLPAVITISLSLGARTLSRHGVLVRRLPAVEALGSITVICADKTGTLTQNRMTVTYPLMGAHVAPNSPTLLETLALCNDAALAQDGHHERGDPMELALLRFATENGLVIKALHETWHRRTELPFDTERKRMTTLHASQAEQRVSMKGAPETVLPLCRWMIENDQRVPLTDDKRRACYALQEQLAARGLRVLAIANRTESDTNVLHEQDMVFLGFVGLEDPPRKEAKAAILSCRSAGIRPMMITGDHRVTAVAIGKALGIYTDGDTVIEGHELRDQTRDWLKAKLSHTSIFARVSPRDKLDIVTMLKENGAFVAMTGDGVNDAPALKAADVGLAMGRGTDVAKEAASLILMQEDFSTITRAIKEGRVIYDNMRKFVRYMIATNLGEITTMLLAGFAGFPAILLPVQILWINLMTDGLPAIALGFEPEEGDVMTRTPRPKEERMTAHGLWQHTVWVGVIMGLCVLALILYADWSGHTADTLRTMAFSSLAFAQMGHLFGVRSEHNPLWKIGFTSNPRLNIAVAITIFTQLILIYTPSLHSIFHTVPLSWQNLGLCFIPAWIIYGLVESEKLIKSRRHKSTQTEPL